MNIEELAALKPGDVAWGHDEGIPQALMRRMKVIPAPYAYVASAVQSVIGSGLPINKQVYALAVDSECILLGVLFDAKAFLFSLVW